MESRITVLLVCLLSVICTCVAAASDVPKALKEKLESRYKGRKVSVVVPQIVVGIYQESGLLDNEFTVHYDHFYPSVQLPGKYQKRNNLDERTTEEVTGNAQVIDQMATGETLQVLAIAVFKRGHDLYMVDLMLRVLAAKRLATSVATSAAGYEHVDKLPFGVHFRFIYPLEVAERGDYETVVHEIDRYVLPEEEYRQSLVSAAQAAKHVELQPGMSKDDVLKVLGQPQKTVVFGKKVILKYPEITVELEDDKLVSVKAE